MSQGGDKLVEYLQFLWKNLQQVNMPNTLPHVFKRNGVIIIFHISHEIYFQFTLTVKLCYPLGVMLYLLQIIGHWQPIKSCKQIFQAHLT